MDNEIRFKGVKREDFIPANIEVDKYLNDIQKVGLKFDKKCIALECPKCGSSMKLTPIGIREEIMELGVKCSKSECRYKFIMQMEFERAFNPSVSF